MLVKSLDPIRSLYRIPAFFNGINADFCTPIKVGNPEVFKDKYFYCSLYFRKSTLYYSLADFKVVLLHAAINDKFLGSQSSKFKYFFGLTKV